ncbi:ABC transporter permease subunit [Bacillus solitudinis]|uniref:ABC transporter permease subunit n=1 Tax=Bacillus solitudinis TaxID=2014074 RepID=UPI00387368E2
MFDRHIAIGGNEEAARLTGNKVERSLINVYSISGLLAGLGGTSLTGGKGKNTRNNYRGFNYGSE